MFAKPQGILDYLWMTFFIFIRPFVKRTIYIMIVQYASIRTAAATAFTTLEVKVMRKVVCVATEHIYK
jgi:hypothetical protein